MRIISGKNKGKKIIPPIDKNTRPLRDIVKEAIFNLIEHSNKFDVTLKNANILDLFSGSGSFGLECISRGAKQVTFMENYKEALKVLKNNIFNIQADEISEVIEKNCFDYFNLKKKLSNKFDIIFLDPPYKEKKINFLIKRIKEEKILDENGILVIHRHKKDAIEITKKLKILDNRLYGISKIIIGN
jgi:16S rRNA (guanine966-N2)-methyltransferase